MCIFSTYEKNNKQRETWKTNEITCTVDIYEQLLSSTRVFGFFQNWSHVMPYNQSLPGATFYKALYVDSIQVTKNSNKKNVFVGGGHL